MFIVVLLMLFSDFASPNISNRYIAIVFTTICFITSCLGLFVYGQYNSASNQFPSYIQTDPKAATSIADRLA